MDGQVFEKSEQSVSNSSKPEFDFKVKGQLILRYRVNICNF